MIILGLTGPIGHGKTSVANSLARMEPTTYQIESGQLVIEVANGWLATLSTPPEPYNIEQINEWLKQLPPIVNKIVNASCSFDQIELVQENMMEHPVEYQKLLLHVENMSKDPNLAKPNITLSNKAAYRALLQWIGGYLVSTVDPGIWFNEIARRINQLPVANCKLCIVTGLRLPMDAIIMNRIGAKIIKVYRPGHLQGDMFDPTERERDSIQCDSVVVNDGTLNDLETLARQMIADLSAGGLKPSYHTTALAAATSA